MKKLITLSMLVLLPVCLAAFIPFALAGEPVTEEPVTEEPALPPLEKLLPEKTVLMVTIPDFPNARSKVMETALLRLAKQSEMSQALKPALELLTAKWNEVSDAVKAQCGYSLEELIGKLAGQVSLAIVDFEPDDESAIDLLISIDVTNQMTGEMLLRKGERILANLSGGQLQPRQYEIDGIGVATIQPDKNVNFFYGCISGTIVFCTKERTFEGVIRRALDEEESKSLAESPSFMGAVSAVKSADAQLFAYANFERFLEKMADELATDPDFEGTSAMLGFKSIKSMAYSLSIENRVFVDRFHLYAPGKRTGLLKMASLPPTALKTAERVPARACYYFSTRIEAKLWIQSLLEALDNWDSAAHAAALQGIDFLKAQGIDIEALLPMIGNELGLFAALSRGISPMPDFGIMLELKKPDEFAAHIGKWLARFGPESPVTSAEYKGITIHALNFGKGFEGMPAFAVHKGYLTFASTPQLLKELIELSDTPEKSLAKTDKFAGWLKRAGGGGCIFGAIDTSSVFGGFYQFLLQQARVMVRRDKLPLKLAALPTVETIAEYLEPVIVSVKSSEKGISLRGSGPVPGPVSVAPLLGIILPAVFVANVADKQTGDTAAGEEKITAAAKLDSEVNLGKILFAAVEYADEHGAYPSSANGNTQMFQKLLNEGFLTNPAVLVAPGGKEQVAEETASGFKITENNVSYMFTDQILPQSAPVKAILCYEKGPYSGEGKRAVLFVDGRVRIIKDSELDRLLVEQKKR
ncbi:MAG: hypothetical protein E3J72_15080 [Planctomycetota bacterium]|nr:MAG: hypothetical protein E3J72_15080 [Planctomycetota bacterium]